MITTESILASLDKIESTRQNGEVTLVQWIELIIELTTHLRTFFNKEQEKEA